jgi:hypothetical protein
VSLTNTSEVIMNTRLPTNPNLTLHTDRYFRGMQVQISHGPLISNYLESMDQVIQNAVREHPRTLVIRIDLRVPQVFNCPDVPLAYDNSVMSRFTESFKAQVKANLIQRSRMGKRFFKCTMRVVWVAEHDSVMNDHYHLVILVNRDAYDHLGDITAIEGNMAARIKKAWASALGLELREIVGLVHFTNNGLFRLNANSPSFTQDYHNLFEAISYLAKAKTKHFGDGTKSFGCSRC